MAYSSFVDGDQVESTKFNENFESTLDGMTALKTKLTGLSQITFPFEWSTHTKSVQELRFRFISPDDLEIYVVGISVQYDNPLGPLVLENNYTVEINGTTTDFENDLPETPHLFLTESIDGAVSKADVSDESNVLKARMAPGGQVAFALSRYLGRRFCIDDPTIDGTVRKPLNMFLKGASYDITIKRDRFPVGAIGSPVRVDWTTVYILYEAKRRRT